MDSFLKQYCSKEWQDFVEFHKTEFEFDAGESIFKEGDKTKGLFIVNQGKVKVVTTDAEGKEVLIRLAADGHILGHRGFGGDLTYPISAICFVKTKVTFIPLNVFQVVAKSNVDFTYNLMMFYAEELRRSEEKIMQLPVKNRVSKSILLNYQVFGYDEDDDGRLSYTLSRKDIASKSGTTYETVIRVLSDLNKSGIIKIEGKAIRILNLEELIRLADPKTSETVQNTI